MAEKIIAYHFTGATLRDGRPVPVAGETLTHDGPIEWCTSGLYASRKPHQALEYAPGSLLHLVECEDIEREDGSKFVCRKRTIIKTIDADILLLRFAADQALSVAHLWDMPEIVRDYLTTLDESKRDAAWDATGDAARDAARNAACDATRAAAWDAAMAATWGAARIEAWDAAWSAARYAARYAARAAARAATWGAARIEARAAAMAATWGAARIEAWDAAMADFDVRVRDAFGETKQTGGRNDHRRTYCVES